MICRDACFSTTPVLSVMTQSRWRTVRTLFMTGETSKVWNFPERPQTSVIIIHNALSRTALKRDPVKPPAWKLLDLETKLYRIQTGTTENHLTGRINTGYKTTGHEGQDRQIQLSRSKWKTRSWGDEQWRLNMSFSLSKSTGGMSGK